MAGTLLLINKDLNRQTEFHDLSQRFKIASEKIYGKYFHKIIPHTDESSYLLIEFRKNDVIKYYKNKQGSWLTYEGNIFAIDKTQKLNAKELWDLYQQYGTDFANQLDGHFVIKIYDKQTDNFLVINDIIKNKTNFVINTEAQLLFTPLLLFSAMIEKPVLDQHAFNEFLWRYYILSNRSILENSVRLEPASIYKISNGHIFRETYWQWPHKFSDISYNNSVDSMVTSMQETARLIYHSFGKPSIDLTMGQDSRQIVAAFTNQKIPMATAIYGKPDFYEVVGVKDMAERHGYELHNIQLESDFLDSLWNNFDDGVILGNCEQPGFLLGRILYMKRKYSEFGNVSLNGFVGYFYKNGLWDELYTLNLYREPRHFNIDRFLQFRAMSKNYNDTIFQPDFLKIKAQTRDYLTKIVQASVADYCDSPVSIQVDRFSLYHWLNFGITGNATIDLIFDNLSPLMLRRNLELALEIPVQWKFNLSKWQRDVVYQLDPELAKEKTDFGGVNMVPKNVFTYIPFAAKYYYFQSARLRNKLKSRLGLKPVTHLQEAWDYLPVYKQLADQRQFRENLDYQKMSLAPILDKENWSYLIDSMYKNDASDVDDYEYLFKLVTIEHFLSLAQSIAKEFGKF